MASREWTRNSIIELIDWYLRKHAQQGAGNNIILNWPYSQSVVSSGSPDGLTRANADLRRVAYNPYTTVFKFNNIAALSGMTSSLDRAAVIAALGKNGSTISFTSSAYLTYFSYFDMSAWSLVYAWIASSGANDTIIYKLKKSTGDYPYQVAGVMGTSSFYNDPDSDLTLPLSTYLRNTETSGLLSLQDFDSQISSWVDWDTPHLILSDTQLSDETIISYASLIGLGTKTSVEEKTI